VGQVGGLGAVTIRIREIQESPVGPDTMFVFFDSSELGLSNFHLALTEVATQAVGHRFETDVFGPSFVRVPASQSTTATLSRVENHESPDGGLFEPVWIVAKGLTSLGPADHGQINSLPFELAVAPAPVTSGATARSVVRFREPVLFVRKTEQNQAPNVQPALEEADPEDPNQIASRHYNVFVNAQSQGLLARRSTGSASLSKLVGIRGRRMKLVHSFITIDPQANLLDSIEIPGATVVRQEQETETLPFGEGEVFRVKTTFSVEIGEKESPGKRNITFRLTDDTTKNFRDAFVISRGRMVVFAVDGLSFEQFDAVRGDDRPRLDEGRAGSALNRIFGQGQQHAIIRKLSTTFPPITYTRWASVFSGEPPGEHLAPSLTWFNRQALIGGSQTGAQPNQGLLKEDLSIVLDAHENKKAYNRFFQVNFVYDNLRAEGFRSVVVNQQAGLGRGNRQVEPDDDIWRRITSHAQIIEDAKGALEDVRDGGAFEILDFFASMLAFIDSPQDLFDPEKFPRDARELLISDGMDREAIEWAIELIGQTGGEFDLMVIYLPGLDHAMHAFGPSGKRGEQWFQTGLLGVDERTSLHGRINRVFKALQEQDLADSTVFGVLSDHGHYNTDPDKFMDLDERGSLISGNPPQFCSVLQVDENHLVGGAYSNSLAGRLFGRNANVIFDPQFGLAYIYVAGGIRSRSEFDWTKAPTVEELEPIVNAIFNSYIGPADALRPWPDRPIADILVRLPANPDTFEGSEYKVVPRDYDPNRSNCGNGTERCGLAEQLAELGTLRDKGIGEAPVSPWKYNNPDKRIADLVSANSGDIILLVNARYGYQFGPPFKGQHGSLTEADSVVPVAFGYPGATGDLDDDDTLSPVIEFLSEQQFPESPIQAIVEALAIEKFFGVERPQSAETEEP
jgi:predicted AlkP superfamily pyrophosphatase or phosphodiesterase